MTTDTCTDDRTYGLHRESAAKRSPCGSAKAGVVQAGQRQENGQGAYQAIDERAEVSISFQFASIYGMGGLSSFLVVGTSDSNSGAAMLVVLLLLYFLPTLIASSRKRQNKEAIAVLNLLLGWTVLGWIASLIWAITDPSRPDVPSVPTQPSLPADTVSKLERLGKLKEQGILTEEELQTQKAEILGKPEHSVGTGATSVVEHPRWTRPVCGSRRASGRKKF